MARKPSQFQLESLLRTSLDATVDSPLGELIQQLAADKMTSSTLPITIVDRDIDGSTWKLPSIGSESESSLPDFLKSIGVKATIIDAARCSDDSPLPFGALDFPPLHDRLSDFCLILPRFFDEIFKQLGLKVNFNRVRIEVAWIILFAHLIRRHCSTGYAWAMIANYLRSLRDNPSDRTIRFSFKTDEGEKEEELDALFASIRKWSLPALLYAGFDFVPHVEDIFRMREALTLATLGDTPTKSLYEMKTTGYFGKFETKLKRLFELADHPGRRKAFVDACQRVAISNPRAIKSTLEINSRISLIVAEMRKLQREKYRKYDPIDMLPRHSMCVWLRRGNRDSAHNLNDHIKKLEDEEEQMGRHTLQPAIPRIRLLHPIAIPLSEIGAAAYYLHRLNGIDLSKPVERLDAIWEFLRRLRKRHHDECMPLDEYLELYLNATKKETDAFRPKRITARRSRALVRLKADTEPIQIDDPNSASVSTGSNVFLADVNPPNVFKKQNDLWFVRFNGTDMGYFDGKLRGFAYIAYLIARPREQVDVEVLYRAASPLSIAHIHSIGEDESLLHTTRTPNSVIQDLGQNNNRVSPAARKVRERIREIKTKLDYCKMTQVPPPSELVEELANLQQSQNVAFNIKGRERNNSNLLKNRKDSIVKAISTALSRIKQSNSESPLAIHLKFSINQRSNVFVYSPENNIFWLT